MYNFRQFNKMNMRQQYALLRAYGVYLKVNRMNCGFHISLFSLNNYYVEVWCDKDDGKLWNIKAFKAYKKLDPFIKEINLSLIHCLH